MSGKEYYCFVTDPQNKGRCFYNMGDIVLECTRAEYKKFKAEDDHSSYILEQEAGWTTLSLESVIGEKGGAVRKLLQIPLKMLKNLPFAISFIKI